jgi:hypothetical protein
VNLIEVNDGNDNINYVNQDHVVAIARKVRDDGEDATPRFTLLQDFVVLTTNNQIFTMTPAQAIKAGVPRGA